MQCSAWRHDIIFLVGHSACLSMIFMLYELPSISTQLLVSEERIKLQISIFRRAQNVISFLILTGQPKLYKYLMGTDVDTHCLVSINVSPVNNFGPYSNIF